jgi:hypothetical protein
VSCFVIFSHDGFGFAAERAKFTRPLTQEISHMRVSARIIILVLALVGAVPALVAQKPRAPIVKVEGLRHISFHVPIIPDNSVPLRNGAVG